MALLPALLVLGLSGPVLASTWTAEEPHRPMAGWSHEGAMGTFDRAALQRGYQVYKEVCSTCHSMKYLSYRNLADLGFSEAEVKAIAAAANGNRWPERSG